MRFIGNKEKLVKTIFNLLHQRNILGNTFFDFFSGTSSVGKFFKKNNYQIFSSDILYFSYCLQRAYIVNNSEPKFENLLSEYNKTIYIDSNNLDLVLNILNGCELKKGFIYENYSPEGSKSLNQPRMYFSNSNAQKIDAIRIQIEDWYNYHKINENEYFILLSCLIESVPFYSNILGVYGAFKKSWDHRALKDFIIRPIEIINNNMNNFSFNINSMDLLNEINVDILYLDPPYNNRQYAPNYHILETVARYDNPNIRGVAGLRDYAHQKSSFCNKKLALLELDKIVKQANYKYLILSYNSEGIMDSKDIINVLKQKGNVELIEIDYKRFKSNNNGNLSNQRIIKEQLYILSSY